MIMVCLIQDLIALVPNMDLIVKNNNIEMSKNKLSGMS